MDWTFWVAGVVIIVLVVVTQVFFHESRWSRRPRDEDPIDADDPADDPTDDPTDGSPADPTSPAEGDDDRSR